MTDIELLEFAKGEGFTAALIDPEQVPVDAKFRVYCEENLCGNYGANYACPPDCGTVEELHQKLLKEEKVLIVQTEWDIVSYDDKPSVCRARTGHNAAVMRLMGKLRKAGFHGFCAGYNGCPLCDPCKRKENLPCAHPEERIICLSAYCVDVTELMKRCDIPYSWTPGKLYLCGMIAFHEEETK